MGNGGNTEMSIKRPQTTLLLNDHVKKQIHKLQSTMIEKTQKTWSFAKIMNMMMLYSIEKGIKVEDLIRLESKYKDG
jgi:hypothetical protein